jgi:hypothetical protein
MAIGKEIDDTSHNIKNCSDIKERMVLHRKEEQLRRKEEQLRRKEEQLREKEKDLRWEKQRLYDLELHNLLLRSNTASELKTHHSKLCDCKYLLA